MSLPPSPSEHDPLRRALAALPPPPPPPPYARVRGGFDGPRAGWASPLARLGPLQWLAAAALVLAVGLGVLVVDASRARRAWETAQEPASGPAPFVAYELLEGYVLLDPAGGPGLAADEPARLRACGGVEVAVDTGFAGALEGPRSLRVDGGRARFDVPPAPPGDAPFRVVADGVEVVVRGTRFAVDAGGLDGVVGGPSAPRRVLVTVDEGVVEANGHRLAGGWGLAFLGGALDGPPWPLDARPTVRLEVEDERPVTSAPVVLRIVLENPTGGWLTLPERDAVRAPVWVEVTGPDGATTPVRVTAAMLLAPDRPSTALPPHGAAFLRVRFDRTFASPGAYRLRAIYRSADAVERPISPDVYLSVR